MTIETSLIALLGRRERPTDGVEDYCHYLAEALSRRGVRMETARVEWDGCGWIPALKKLRRQCGGWRGSLVVVHYTALAWSRRGFPFGILIVLRTLRRRGVRCAVLFHETARQLGRSRLRDRLRGACQDWLIRRCFRAAEIAIFTVPLEMVAWLPRNRSKAVYVPIGANIPERVLLSDRPAPDGGSPKTVAVFCLSLSENRSTEISDLAHAAGSVQDAIGAVRFVVLGKGSAEARAEVEGALHAKGVEVSVLGRLPAEEVSDTLAAADVLLYLCGIVTQTRGSALAGVACGLPIVGYSGQAREPVYDAGVELVPYRDRQMLAAALVRVLKDGELRAELRRKSAAAQQRHFSWDSIAGGFLRALNPGPASK
jgi:glycosyltransferase involved in cell wall biosynthesis